MTLRDYEKWREGYIKGINVAGDFLKIFKNIENNKLRETIEVLQKEWSGYGKTSEKARKEKRK